MTSIPDKYPSPLSLPEGEDSFEAKHEVRSFKTDIFLCEVRSTKQWKISAFKAILLFYTKTILYILGFTEMVLGILVFGIKGSR